MFNTTIPGQVKAPKYLFDPKLPLPCTFQLGSIEVEIPTYRSGCKIFVLGDPNIAKAMNWLRSMPDLRKYFLKLAAPGKAQIVIQLAPEQIDALLRLYFDDATIGEPDHGKLVQATRVIGFEPYVRSWLNACVQRPGLSQNPRFAKALEGDGPEIYKALRGKKMEPFTGAPIEEIEATKEPQKDILNAVFTSAHTVSLPPNNANEVKLDIPEEF